MLDDITSGSASSDLERTTTRTSCQEMHQGRNGSISVPTSIIVLAGILQVLRSTP